MNLFENPSETTEKPIQKIINQQLDVKLGQSSKGELDAVLTKIKNRKATDLEEKYPLKFERQENLTIHYSDYTAQSLKNATEKWTKSCILPFPKKDNLRIKKNYRIIALL